MNTTYDTLKKAGILKSYWGKIIRGAEMNGRFTPENEHEAGEWQTCACGHQSANIPRAARTSWGEEHPASYAEPDDKLLREYGVRFAHNISDNNPLDAARTLVQIEKRAAKVMGAELDKYVARMDWHVPPDPDTG